MGYNSTYESIDIVGCNFIQNDNWQSVVQALVSPFGMVAVFHAYNSFVHVSSIQLNGRNYSLALFLQSIGHLRNVNSFDYHAGNLSALLLVQWERKDARSLYLVVLNFCQFHVHIFVYSEWFLKYTNYGRVSAQNLLARRNQHGKCQKQNKYHSTLFLR